ncbi:MAG: hypothetical protein J6I42_12750 [Clostridia bacterium]|nr:hypothetical protein [Oscillospiraceae bacterium]MBO4933041.1 hypothetical protein [Clostridia bacterium]
MVNDIYYVCALIEYVARKQKCYPDAVVKQAGLRTIEHFFEFADVYHCQSFEESGDEFIEYAGGIKKGQRDLSQYEKVPAEISVALTYTSLIKDIATKRSPLELPKPMDGISREQIPEIIYRVMTNSFIVRQIENYHSDFYYSGSSYVLACYKEGKVLD